MDDYAEELRRAQLKKRLVISTAVLLILVAPCLVYWWNTSSSLESWANRPSRVGSSSGSSSSASPAPATSGAASPEQIAVVDSSVATFQASLDAEIAAWREAMSEARDLVALPALGPCPFRVPLPEASPTTPIEGPMGLQDTRVVGLTPEGGRVAFETSREPAFDYVIVHDGQLPAEPALARRIRGEASDLTRRIRLDAGPNAHERVVRRAEALERITLRWDVTIFVERMREPRVVGHAFDAGEIAANAVVYDYQRDEAACAVWVDAAPHRALTIGATSTGPSFQQDVVAEIDGRHRMEGALWVVLEDALEREIARNLRYRAGPSDRAP